MQYQICRYRPLLSSSLFAPPALSARSDLDDLIKVTGVGCGILATSTTPSAPHWRLSDTRRHVDNNQQWGTEGWHLPLILCPPTCDMFRGFGIEGGKHTQEATHPNKYRIAMKKLHANKFTRITSHELFLGVFCLFLYSERERGASSRAQTLKVFRRTFVYLGGWSGIFPLLCMPRRVSTNAVKTTGLPGECILCIRFCCTMCFVCVFVYGCVVCFFVCMYVIFVFLVCVCFILNVYIYIYVCVCVFCLCFVCFVCMFCLFCMFRLFFVFCAVLFDFWCFFVIFACVCVCVCVSVCVCYVFCLYCVFCVFCVFCLFCLFCLF